MKKETKTYLVGGAVRDELLGLNPQDLDYVVVNGSEDVFLAQGFSRVGHSFPVFLHPDTHDQYAFARKEKKVAAGYHGFEFEIQNVTLEEDLFRRDLTINAMAKDENGNLVDPFNGLEDLNNKVLKHVSPHFAEDPLRVLRVARFQARYTEFSIHPTTLELMKTLCEKEATSLAKDRFRAETIKALTEKEPFLYFKTLEEVGFFKAFGTNLALPLFLKLSSDIELALMQLSLYQADYNKFITFMIDLLKLGKNNKKQVLYYRNLWEISKEDSCDKLLQAFLKAHVTNNFVFLNKMKEVSQFQKERILFWEKVESAALAAKKIDTSFVLDLAPKERSAALEKLYQKLF